jgi:tetratricopeptide (TPR) repeat protein
MPTQGGINFFIGNNPEATGWSAAMPEPLGQFWQYADCKYIAEKEIGRELSPREVSSFWLKRGLGFWSESPVEAISLTFKKIWLLISNQDISNNRNIDQFKQSIPISNLFFVSLWLIFPFAVLGAVNSFRINRKVKLITIFMVLYSAVIVLFFVTSRFRLPLLPFAVILAAEGMFRLWSIIKSKDSKKLIASIGLIMIVSLLTLMHPYDIDFSNPEQRLYSEGNRLLLEGEYKAARQVYHELLQINPVYPQVHMNLAASYVKTGQLDSAIHYYQRELALNPYSSLSLSSLAELERLRGNTGRAHDLASAALSQKPYFTEIMIV